MPGFLTLLRQNRNYRLTWTGQVVSDAGDHFNNIAVFALVMDQTLKADPAHSGLAISAVMLARAVGMLAAGPVAGVILDRFDRRRIMIASDLVRAVIAMGFIAAMGQSSLWLLLILSGILMFASPFFTSGRAAILPVIASGGELHTANSLTQTTQWITVSVGAFLAGIMSKNFGYQIAFAFNSLSFLVSAACISLLRAPPGASFTARRDDTRPEEKAPPWREYVEGLRYMVKTPLIFAIGLVGVGWATGGGAAQILFSLFGEVVFQRGVIGISVVWGCAGIGLAAGGFLANAWGEKIDFRTYKWLISVCYVLHGGCYVLFSISRSFAAALVFIAFSRFAVAISSILNFSQILRHVPDNYRGRVISTQESMAWAAMMVSMLVAGIASQTVDPRTIGVVAGILSSTTALFWGWANWRGWLPEPPLLGGKPEVVIHEEAGV